MSNKYYETSLSLPEIFKKVSELEGTLEEKVELLRIYDNQVIEWFVDVMYHAPLKDIQIPGYIASVYPVGNNSMSIQSSRIQIEYVIQNKESPGAQRTLRTILESVHKDEAALIVNLLEGKKIPGISKGVWKRLYPVYFPESAETTLEDTQEDD